jgi:hypothetical protein
MSPNKELVKLHIDMLKDCLKREQRKLKKDPNDEFVIGRISAMELSIYLAKELKKDIK